MALHLTACGWVGQTLKSELSAYAEPTEGDVAHLRLIGSRNVKVYPDSVCAGVSVPGGGYPAGPQMGGQRTRDIGMPKRPGLPEHYVEIAVRAGQPITVSFNYYRESHSVGIAGTGAPGHRQSSVCQSMATLVPVAGESYEMEAAWGSDTCQIEGARLVRMPGTQAWHRVHQPLQGAKACGSTD
ncbi:hypothetical protein B1992_11060 [Pseudoxanthomonas broegbernensis]|uniref:Uncharacterized protein n=1 Tax=Pseudoxanthomonas broegbernensis TaxID=83619 RepID=A0A7V8GLE9_9GAMM|nr:hypothetical protein B1992_11060 [Pseudoxanthomonas broegbernensis]